MDIFIYCVFTSMILLRFLKETIYSLVHAILLGECPTPTIFNFFSFATATLKISLTWSNDLGSKYRCGWHSYVWAQFWNRFPFISFYWINLLNKIWMKKLVYIYKITISLNFYTEGKFDLDFISNLVNRY